MKLLQDVSGLETDLQDIDRLAKELCADHLYRQPLSDVLDAAFKNPGKLLRPALVLLFGRFGPDYLRCTERLKTAGVIVELTHMASLIHDDIVDDAPNRRGKPSVQSAFGKDIAVYGGDYLLSRVLQALTTQGMMQIAPVLSRGIADMCSGEMSQHQAKFDCTTDENRYFMTISGKTAALFSSACEIGALVSGCTQYIAEIAGRFGHCLGILFQLRDDLLDCLPDRDGIGKPQGLDFPSGIYTLPVIYSFADPVNGPALKKLAENNADISPEDQLRQMRRLVSEAGGLDYTRWMMKQYREQAIHALSQLPSHEVKLPLASVLDELLAF